MTCISNSTSRPRISAALALVAGANANAVAAASPFPHNEFLALSPARMHLAGILLSEQGAVLNMKLLTHGKFAEIAALLSSSSQDFSEGILGAIPLPMWTDAEYQKLRACLACAKAKLVLLHTKKINPSFVVMLADLPVELRVSKVVRHLRRPLEAKVLASFCIAPGKAQSLVQTLDRVSKREAFWEKVREFLLRAETFPPLPHVDHPLIKPITNLAELRRAAMEYGNCLRSFGQQAVNGEIAFYRFDGDDPAIVSIRPRFGGLVIEALRGPGNRKVEVSTFVFLTGIFKNAGIGLRTDHAVKTAAELCASRLSAANETLDDVLDEVCNEYFTEVKAFERVTFDSA